MVVSLSHNRVSDHLDLIRGLSAVAVLVYHVRYRFFLDYRDVIDRDAFAAGFYGITAFGHDAVMVFFVLSGFFISGSVFRDLAGDRWSWTRYAASRFSRLYVVLLPGLILTVVFDLLGLALFGTHPIYTGAARPWLHDFFPVADRLTVPTFVANALFLQMVLAPPLGSNDPLWSLSFEFWYYFLFPLAWLSLGRFVGRGIAVLYLLLCLLLLLGLGRQIAIYFPIWLLGTAIALLPPIPILARRHSGVVTLTVVLAFVLFVAASHSSAFRALVSGSVVKIDYLNAIAFSLALYVMVHDRSVSRGGRYAAIAAWLAAFSYTLYVVHMPILVFLRAALLPDAPWPPDLPHVLLGATTLAVGCATCAFAISTITERRTARVRDMLIRWFSRKAGS